MGQHCLAVTGSLSSLFLGGGEGFPPRPRHELLTPPFAASRSHVLLQLHPLRILPLVGLDQSRYPRMHASPIEEDGLLLRTGWG